MPVSTPLSGVTYFFFAPLFIPFFILGRAARRHGVRLRPPHGATHRFHTPDKEHIHHRLLRLGHGHRRSVVILWAWTALLSGFVLFPLFVQQVNAFIPFGAAALGVGLYTLFHPGLRRAAEPRTSRRRPIRPTNMSLTWSDGAPSVTRSGPWPRSRADARLRPGLDVLPVRGAGCDDVHRVNCSPRLGPEAGGPSAAGTAQPACDRSRPWWRSLIASRSTVRGMPRSRDRASGRVSGSHQAAAGRPGLSRHGHVGCGLRRRGVVLGLLGDRAWHTAPLFFLIGLVLGLAAAVASVVAQIRRFL